MGECELNLLLKYPLMRVTNSEKSEYSGYLQIGDKDYEISVKQVGNKFVLNAPELDAAIKSEIDAAFIEGDVVKYLDTLQSILSHKLASQEYFTNRSGVYRLVLNEYSDLSQFCMNFERCWISADLTEIRIAVSDTSNRKHEAVISVGLTKKGDIFSITKHDLPDTEITRELCKGYSSLRTVFDKYVCAIESLQDFFDVMDAFDENFWIIDPEKPCRSDTHRRVVLGDNMSSVVIFDPLNVRSVPNVKFLGPDRLMEQYQAKLVENIANWDSNGDVIAEFLRLLGVDSLPRKPTDNSGVDMLVNEGECCICFSLRLGNDLPEVICPNKSCEVSFHVQCLYQWLSSLNSRRSFKEVVGNCPNCDKRISCPVP